MPEYSVADAAHELALRYVQTWANTANGETVLYIEGFPDHGTLLRVSALPPRASVILVEEDPTGVARLREALRPPEHGAISIVEADLAGAVASIAERAADAGHGLVQLQPSAPGKLPLEAIRTLAAVPVMDFWIRFPQEDLHRLARFRGGTLADLPPYARRIVDGYSRMLDDPRHSWAAEWWRLGPNSPPDVGERLVAERFRDVLQRAVRGRAVKPVSLKFPTGEALYLFCITGEPERALALNIVLDELGLDELASWDSGRFRHPHSAPVPAAETLDFFSDGRLVPDSPGRELDQVALADTLARRYASRTATLREIMRDLLLTDVLPEDVRRTLRLLRRSGHALFRSLKAADVEVRFPSEPLPPAGRERRATWDVLELLPPHHEPR
jgi:three-Cys-motif partner protein